MSFHDGPWDSQEWQPPSPHVWHRCDSGACLAVKFRTKKHHKSLFLNPFLVCFVCFGVRLDNWFSGLEARALQTGMQRFAKMWQVFQRAGEQDTYILVLWWSEVRPEFGLPAALLFRTVLDWLLECHSLDHPHLPDQETDCSSHIT